MKNIFEFLQEVAPIPDLQERVDEMTEDEVNQELLANHDCHASPEDGCSTCDKIMNE